MKDGKKAVEFVSIWVIAYLFSLAQIRGNSLGEFHLAICRYLNMGNNRDKHIFKIPNVVDAE